ncbi:hypothetical protein O0I10_005109 [Lichtheimia ornata]|uniref:Uncharacterized protein n=1 Tax=Lichtheimia ornata TaxID=688661 RepID=A0AAD7V5W0_9FUNG|nr:uncharacterized protein O0I10_005109 [Lichtheimia ornata]KAJ8659071.1 hypothetical protein O0I10_005109 [Lichtheimia ornata]
MPLAALQHVPAQTTVDTGRRWRKGLAVFARRFRNHGPTSTAHCSRMAMAAATEKVVWSRPPDVKCEDLTAREFAQLAGIKIKDENEDNMLSTITTATAPPPLMSVNNQSTTCTSLSSDSRQQQPRIWDSDFWCCQQQQQQEAHDEDDEDAKHLPVPNVIKKGRFRIVVGQANDIEDDRSVASLPVMTRPPPPVLEWKRKRSS